MAKRKKDEVGVENTDDKGTDFKIPADLKDFADNINSAQSIIDRPRKVISISPSIDMGLGGGVLEGTWLVFGGPPKCGKTTTVVHTCKKILEAKPNARVFYHDVEGRSLQKRTLELEGLDLSRFQVIKSEKSKILMAEDHLEIMEYEVRNFPDCVLVIDSVSCFIDENADQASYRESVQTTKPNMLMARFIRKCAGIVPVNDIIVIAINQMMANPTGYGASNREKAVSQLLFQADNKLRCIKSEPIESDGRIVGQNIRWKIEATCLAKAMTQMEISSVIFYGLGVHENYELVKMAMELGVIKKAGAWYKFTDEEKEGDDKEKKMQGEHKVLAAFENEPDFREKVVKAIKEMI